MTNQYKKSFLAVSLSDDTPKKAFYTACFGGTILTLINHGDMIISGEFPPLMKVLLTYCVPFCVTTWGTDLGQRQHILQQNKITSSSIPRHFGQTGSSFA